MIRDVIIKDVGRKGKGVFAVRSFRRGEFIFRGKRGPIVHRKDLKRLSRQDLKHLNEIDEDKFEMMRSPAKFINHSCSPNAIAKGTSLFALKQIKMGEEITTDYRVTGLFKNRWRCHCGSKNCNGCVVSDFFTLPERLQKKYLPYTLKFIREEYERRHVQDLTS